MNWTPSDLDYLRQHYGNKDLYLIAWHLRRTEDAVVQKHREMMKVKKTNIE
jgi:hypothetical protein